MITLSRGQMAVLAASREEDFIDAMAAHLRQHLGTEVSPLDDATLRRRIAAAIPQAERFGLVSERDIAGYLQIKAACGWNFERRLQGRWIVDFLEDESLGPPSQRLEAALDQCVERLLDLEGS